MNKALQSILIESGRVSQEQINAADAHAAEQHVSPEQALLDLKMLSQSDLGGYLAASFSMPYVPLANRTASPASAIAISMDCARHWNVFPLEYDSRQSLLTLSVDSPALGERMQKIFTLLMEPHDLAFTIATASEIKAALSTTAQTPAPAAQKQAEPAAPAKQRLSISAPKQASGAQATPSVTSRPERTRPVEPAKPAKPEISDELHAALVSAISLLVMSHLTGKAQDMARIRTRARYCQLTASRLNLPLQQTTRLLLAAWLSALNDKQDVLKQLVTPFDLSVIPFTRDPGSSQDLETMILTLIRCFQDLEIESPADARDVNLTRRAIQLRWSAAENRTDLIETFLQVLMDEQYLDKLGKHAGNLLLMDRNASLASRVEAGLERAGYNIHLFAATPQAIEFMAATPPDLIIINSESGAREMLEFCRMCKTESATSSIPMLVTIPANPELRGAEYLRAGAEDVLSLPVDMEMLYLKLEKLLAGSHRAESRKGVSGSLADMSFSDLIQVLTAGGKSTELTIDHAGEEGKLCIKNGNVIHAQAGALVGDRAFYQLMRWRDGEFSMRECSEFPTPTITSSTMSLLMEGARLADENLAV